MADISADSRRADHVVQAEHVHALVHLQQQRERLPDAAGGACPVLAEHQGLARKVCCQSGSASNIRWQVAQVLAGREARYLDLVHGSSEKGWGGCSSCPQHGQHQSQLGSWHCLTQDGNLEALGRGLHQDALNKIAREITVNCCKQLMCILT